MAAVVVPPQTLNKTKQTKSSYRPEIDGLRAFAVIAVIINHFNKDLLPSGYLGVDIFFVISGYVITSSLSGRQSKNFGDFLGGFYERRIKRLVPALVVFILVTSILICLFNPDPGTALKTGITSLFGLSNLYLFRQSTDYFAQSTELNPFTHTWSLGVEEQFYLLFPFLIWFSGFGRQAKNGARNLFLWIGALTVASFVSFICLYQTNQPAAYFLMPPRFWEMAAGCLVFIGFQKRAKIEQALEHVPPLLVVAAMVAVMFLPISSAVLATISIVLLSAILIACLKRGTAAFDIFTNKRVVYIGLISYSLYLWHWGILSLGRWSIGIQWWSTPLLIMFMFLLASSSYFLVERPLRQFSSKNVSRIWVFSGGFLALFASATGLTALEQFRISGLSLTKHLYIFANPGVNFVAATAPNGAKIVNVFSAPPWNDEGTTIDGTHFARCHFSRPVRDVDYKSCLKPSSSGSELTPQIYIFGDSHAMNYAFAVRKAFPGKVSVITVGWGCGYLSLKDSKQFDSANMNCTDYVNKVDDFVGGLGEGDVVVLGNDWRKDSIKRNSSFQESAIRKLAKLTVNRGAYFVLLDDVPAIGDPLVSARKWYRPFAPLVTKHQVDNDLAGLDAIGDRITKDFHGAIYLSLRTGLCDVNLCSADLGGKVIYFNDGHITVEASEKLAPGVKKKLSRIFNLK